MIENFKSMLLESIKIRTRILADESLLKKLEDAANIIKTSVAAGGTIYTCGNGGSCCDAMHFAEELVARYKRDRLGIRAFCFSDPGTLTCWGNDIDFESAFARCAETFCTTKDILVGFSTSGNSGNVIKAIEAAKAKGAWTLAFTGKTGGSIKNVADCAIVVPSNETERIQELHITFVHMLCEMLETDVQMSYTSDIRRVQMLCDMLEIKL